MEHITVIDLGNGYMRLVPDKGYMLYHKATDKYYSEAETKDPSQFAAVAKE